MEKRRDGIRKKLEESGPGVHKGARQRKGKWSREVRVTNKKRGVWLGSFAQPDMAAIAQDVASMNFPHAATSLLRFHSHTYSIRDNDAVEEAEKYASGQGTETYAASALSWDMRISEMGLEGGSKTMYWDEEEVFNMPALINSMAEGLIIPPPALQTGFNWLPPETPLNFTLWAD